MNVVMRFIGLCQKNLDIWKIPIHGLNIVYVAPG